MALRILRAPRRRARTAAWAAQLFAGVPRATRWSCLALYLIVAPIWLLLLTTQEVAPGGAPAIACSIAALALQVTWVALARRLGPVTWMGLTAAVAGSFLLGTSALARPSDALLGILVVPLAWCAAFLRVRIAAVVTAILAATATIDLVRDHPAGQPAAAVAVWIVVMVVVAVVVCLLAEGKRRSQRIVHRVSEAIDAHLYAGEVLRDGTYRETFTGPGFERFAGPLRSGADPWQTWLAAVHPDDLEGYLAATSDGVLRLGDPVDVEYRLLTPAGERWVWERQRPSNRGDDLLIDGIAVDVTERHEALQRLADVEGQLGRLLRFVEDVVFEVAVPRSGPPELRFITPSVSVLMGGPQPREEALLEEWARLVHEDDRPLYRSFIERVSAGDSGDVEYRIVGLDGRTRWVWERVATRREDDGTVLAAGIISDVSERRAILAELEAAREAAEQQARTDALTGLANRRWFGEIAQRRLAQGPVGLLLLDVDRFKSVNDRWGHATGDEVLLHVARRLQESVSPDAVLARWGGEEFIVLLPGTARVAELERAADALRSVLSAEPVRTATATLAVTASVGAALGLAVPSRLEDLVAAADRALYLAKTDGRNRTVVDDPARGALAGLHDDRAAVEAVIAAGVTIHTQPIVDLRTGRIRGYEALARFPALADSSPASWFARARACGSAELLEAAAIRAALALPERPPDAYLSLNISPSLLLSPMLDEALPGDLNGLILEVTEHELVGGGEAVARALAGLRARGARLAVDDAGAGYAGFIQLLRLRPDLIKLDRSVVDGVARDPHKAALIEAFARFARRIDAYVCAEGLETLEDVLAVADLDVTYGQGYHLARPAAGWPRVDGSIVDECALALAEVVRDESIWQSWTTATSERRLKHIAWRLANVAQLTDLPEVIALIATELEADWVLVSEYDHESDAVESLGGITLERTGERYLLSDFPTTRQVLETPEARQVLVSDADADPAEVALLRELGYGALLMVPIVAGGSAIGLLEVHSVAERPWSRSDVHRAHMIACQLAAVVRALALAGRSEAHEPWRRPHAA